MKTQVRILQVCFIVITILGASAVAHAQEDVIPLQNVPGGPRRGTGSISGKVVLPSGQPVGERARIVLSTMTSQGMVLYTDNSGGFGYAGLGEGVYTIEVSANSKVYETVFTEVRLIRGTHVRVNIALRERVAEAGRPSGNVVSLGELDRNVPAAAKKEFEKATLLVNEGKLQEAIERYKRAIAIYPGYLMARNDLAAQYNKLKLWREAIEQLDAAIEINPKSFNPRLNMGIALVEQKKYVDAMEHLNLAVSIDSSSPAAHLYLGIASVETDELPAAERELSAALTLGGVEYSVVHFYKAQVHLKKGERDGAIRELKTYLKESPTGERAANARQLLETLKE